jgi:hypothetical protein
LITPLWEVIKFSQMDFTLEYESEKDAPDIYCEFCNFSEPVTLLEALDLIGIDIDDPLTDINEQTVYECPRCQEKYQIEININIEK